MGSGSVGWQQQRVEAGVAGGQLVAVHAVALNDAAQVPQAPYRGTVTAREELEEVTPLVLVKLSHNVPEPLDGLHST